MRLALLLLLATGAHAQAVDLSASGGALVALGGEVLITGAAPSVRLAASSTPSAVGGRVRGVASATYAPGRRAADHATAVLGLGAEVPLSGGRNGVYLALGGAFLSVDGPDIEGCLRDPNCMASGGGVSPYTGLAWTGGVGARIPISGRLWLEPAVSTLFWGEALPSARLGVGWRLR